jgi:DNA repair protein RecO
MKARVRDLAIVARVSPYSESSQIIRAFARERGSISLIAKGIRKQKDQLSLLGEYELVIYEPAEGGLYLLSEFNLQREHALFGNPERWAAAECALELLSGLIIPHEEHRGYYDLLSRYLEYLSGLEGKPVLVWWRFLLRVFAYLGIEMHWTHCSGCQGEFGTFPAYDKGSCEPVCQSCLHSNPPRCESLSPQAALVMSLLPEIGKHLGRIVPSRETVSELDYLFGRYYQVHFGKPLRLKSLEVLEQFYR